LNMSTRGSSGRRVAQGVVLLALGGGIVACAVDGVTGPVPPGVQAASEAAGLEESALLGPLRGGDPLARILRFRKELALSPEQVTTLHGIRARFLETNRELLAELRSATPGTRALGPSPLRERIRRQFPQAEARLRAMSPEDREAALERLRERVGDMQGARRMRGRAVPPERMERARERMEERRREMTERRELQRERLAALAPLIQELRDARAVLGDEVRSVLTPEQLLTLDALPERSAPPRTRSRPGTQGP
jgi:hypothetical protein